MRGRGALVDRALRADRQFWEKALAGAAPATIPYDRIGLVGPPEVETIPVLISPATAVAVGAAAGEREALVFTLLVAAFKVVLQHYTGSNDLVVATGVHKQYLETAAMNRLLVLRDVAEPEVAARTFVAQVQKTIAEAFEHQKYPVQRLFEDTLGGQRRETLSILHAALLYDGVHDVRILDGIPTDLTLAFSRDATGLVGRLTYRADRYNQSTMRAFGVHLDAVLGQLLATPDVPISLLRPVHEPPVVAPPSEECAYVHEDFREIARRAPDAIAIAGDPACSYAELNRRSNQLARWLMRMGVTTGTRVAICCDHGIEVVDAILAVLKAGGCYVALDPLQPTRRSALVLEDARPLIVLVQEHLVSVLPEGIEGVTVLESVRAGLSDVDGSDFASVARPLDLAYVLYTSGSTGRPKGVAVPHVALSNYVRWAARTYVRDSTGLTFALFSSMAFDLTVTGVFVPLVTGNSILPYSRALRESAVLRIVEDARVDVLKVTPSHLALLRECNHTTHRIRQLIVGGEALETALASRIRALFGSGIEIINEYGPTEATVGCLAHRFDPGRDMRAFVPVGTEVSGLRTFILDDRLSPVEPHVVGELYVGGASLAHGYLAQPALTAARFVADPFVPGERLYRTGDLARRLPDGPVEFIGRRDGQVKVHGHRIELEELRLALNRHPHVRNSVVMLRHDAEGVQRLVAYYVSQHDIPADELRTTVAESVARELVPHRYVRLTRLPLTLNGKVDHAALPPWETATESQADVDGEPTTAVEELLVGIWSEVLKRERVGVNSNFFELGGHSLLVSQAAARIREVLHVDVPLAWIFETPTVAGLAQRVTAAAAAAQRQPIRPVDRTGVLPLSFAQQRLWLLEQLHPGRALYNVPLAVRWRGPLDITALEESLSGVVRRHEILRTRFVDNGDGGAAQVVMPVRPVVVAVQDWRGADPADQRDMLAALQREEALRPFDLSTPDLLRAVVVRLADDDAVLLITLHHIVCDGWSLDILVRELRAFYDGATRGEAVRLPARPLQYGDFAVWQHAPEQLAAIERDLDYWRERLADAPPLGVPADKGRPAVEDIDGASEATLLDGTSLARIRQFCRQEGITLHMLLVAAWAVVLGRWGNQQDLVVGTTVAGRTNRETDHLIGFFVNTLPLRLQVEPHASVRSFIRAVRRVCLDAYAHQDVPFERIVEVHGATREGSRPALVQSLVTLHQTLDATPAVSSDVDVEPLPTPDGPARFELTLNATAGNDGVGLRLEYRRALFSQAVISRWLNELVALVSAMADAPARSIGELPWLDAVETEQVRSLCTGPRTRISDGVLSRISDQVRGRPDAIACVSDHSALSFAAMDARSTTIARALRARGVGLESRVGVCLSPTPDRIVALLAVWKAGGAYVPLDPAVPIARIQTMIADADLDLLIADSQTRHAWPAAAIEMTDLDDQSAGDVLLPDPHEIPADALAYVMFTSGSTGSPKGIEVAHRGLGNLVDAMVAVFGLGPSSRALQYASIGFDASVCEIFTALAGGATLEICTNEVARGGDALAAMLRERSVTVATLPPSIWRGLTPEALPSLTTVVSAGEACSTDVVRTWAGRRFINAYGPTEATVCATAACGELEAPTLGRPIANTEVFVLDAAQHLVPVGATGEICLAGPGLARGYTRQPALTAERFVPHPFSDEPGARLYRTGDLGWYRADGRLEFAGRADSQVKIHGVRIELGEIEAVLRQQSAVQDAVVVVRDHDGGGRILVAYVTPRDEAGVDVAELRRGLRAHLPAPMQPAAYVILDALPLTTHGKIHRSALPAPGADIVAFEAPRDEVERVLAEIWAEVLGRDRVGVEDNFFELGGDSISSLQVVSRARQRGLVMTARLIFEYPRLSELASALSLGDGRGDDGIVSGDVMLTPIQRWFFEQRFAASGHWNQAMLLALSDGVDPAGVRAALAAIVEHHDALRMRYALISEGWRQFGLPAETAGWWNEMAITSLAEIEGLATGIHASLDLVNGPVQRAVHFALPDGTARLLWVAHHLVVDGVSWRVLLEDLTTAYGQWARGEAIELPPKTASFQRWASALHDYARTPALKEEELPYWLAQAGPRAAVPQDHATGPDTVATSARVALALSQEETEALLALAAGPLRATLHELLLAAVARAYGRWTDQTEFIVDLEGHGRDETLLDMDVSRTVGWFTSVYPVRLPAREPTPEAQLMATKRQLRRVPNHGLGYGLLRYLAEVPELQGPEPEVSLSYGGHWDNALPSDPNFSLPAESSGPASGPRNHRTHLLELSAGIGGHQLYLACGYNRARHRPETVEAFVDGWAQALRDMTTASPTEYVPEEFPLVQLTSEQLGRIAAAVDSD